MVYLAPLAKFWYNTSIHTSTHCTPLKALYGKESSSFLVSSRLNYVVLRRDAHRKRCNRR